MGEQAERYWEARWRDEAAENDRLRAAAERAPAAMAEIIERLDRIERMLFLALNQP